MRTVADRATMLRRAKAFAAVVAAVVFMTGCGPTITVQNGTRYQVRAVVSNGGKQEVFSPSPGESSSVDAEQGSYSVYSVPDIEWIQYTKATRKFLDDQLAHPEKLTGPQLLNVVARLKNIAATLAEFERTEVSLGAACGGTVSQDASVVAVISVATDGTYVANCK